MRHSTFIILIFLLGVSASSYAQLRKKKNKKNNTEQTQQPTTLDPLPEQTQSPPRASRKRNTKGPTFESEQQYYERMEALVKEKRKTEKMMMKPQYSDPMYFGHKRPPKKRKAGKLKYCKECGIRH